MHRLILSACLALGLLVAQPAGAAAPSDVVERFHKALLDIMQNAESLGVGGRYDTLRPVMAETFDMQRMVKVASGRAWEGASESDQTTLTEAFARMSTATYADQFAGFSGESFEIVGVRPGPRDTRLVATRIIRGDGREVPITYVLVADDGTEDWRIGDVLLNNSISQLSVRRSEYRTILEKGGISRLIGSLNQKADEILGS